MNDSDFENSAALEETLKGLRNEGVDPALLAAVRRRVMDQVADRHPSLLYAWRWKYAVPAAAAVLVVAVALTLRRPVEIPPPGLVASLPEAPAVTLRPAQVPARQARKPAPRA